MQAFLYGGITFPFSLAAIGILLRIILYILFFRFHIDTIYVRSIPNGVATV